MKAKTGQRNQKLNKTLSSKSAGQLLLCHSPKKTDFSTSILLNGHSNETISSDCYMHS